MTWKPIVACTIAALCCLALGQEPVLLPKLPAEGIKADLGVSFTQVWFKGLRAKILPTVINRLQITGDPGKRQFIFGSKDVPVMTGPCTPLVSLMVNKVKLANAIRANTKGKVDPQLLDQKITGIAADEGAALFEVVTDDLEPRLCFVVALQPTDEAICLILNGNCSYNDGYVVKFDLSRFLKDVPGALPTGPALINNKTTHLTNRISVSLTTNLAQQDTSLIKVKRDQNGNFEKKDGAYVYQTAKAFEPKFEIKYAAQTNPLQNSLLPEHSYYEATLGGQLSENRFDQKSAIMLQLSGCTDLFGRPKGWMPFTGIRVETSQSLRQLTAVYEIGYRSGDKRIDGNRYVPVSDCKAPVYLEIAAQAGGSWFRNIEDVPMPKRMKMLILRPRIRLGMEKFLKTDGSLLTVTGYADIYGVSRNLGGADDPVGQNDPRTGWKSTFELAIVLGSDAQNITFKISGGDNPAQGFLPTKPSYSIGLAYKF